MEIRPHDNGFLNKIQYQLNKFNNVKGNQFNLRKLDQFYIYYWPSKINQFTRTHFTIFFLFAINL